MSLANVSAVVGLCGVVLSVLLLAWQTFQLTQQVKIANAAAIYNTHLGVTAQHHEILTLLLDRPNLRPYFVAGKPCPSEDPNRAEALLIAGMMADVHDLGLQHTRKVPDPLHVNCWPATIRDSLQQPILNEVLRTPRPWYPELRRFFEKIDSAELPAFTGVGDDNTTDEPTTDPKKTSS
jgi:hypothetical protein